MTEFNRRLSFDHEPQDFTLFECRMNDGSAFSIPNKIWQRAFEMTIPETDREAFQYMLKEKSGILWKRLEREEITGEEITTDDIIEGLDPVAQTRFQDSILDLVGKQASWVQRVAEWEASGFLPPSEIVSLRKLKEAAREMDAERRKEPRTPEEVSHAEIARGIVYPYIRMHVLGIAFKELSDGNVVGLDEEGGATLYSNIDPIYLRDARVLFDEQAR